LSALVGIAVRDGTLREDTRVRPLLRSSTAVAGDRRWQRVSVRDLLTMSSGLEWHQSPPDNTSDAMGHSPDWVRFILERPFAAAPGREQNYSNGDAHLLSAVLQAAVGEPALAFARDRLFAPLGIDDAAWDHDPQGRSIGSAALQLRPVDMATFGLLYARDGHIGGREVVDRRWIRRSLSAHGAMPSKGGPVPYGYYWWLYPERHVAEAWGAAGQRIGVIRDLDAVIVTTGDDPADYPRSPVAARLYDLVRASVKSRGTLPEHPSAAAELARTVAEMTARPRPRSVR
jgi:CubicO group peptidase (beta-lactamase class C family)